MRTAIALLLAPFIFTIGLAFVCGFFTYWALCFLEGFMQKYIDAAPDGDSS